MSSVPFTTLALVAGITPEQLLQRLAKNNLAARSEQQSVKELVGDDFREQVHILKLLLAPDN